MTAWKRRALNVSVNRQQDVTLSWQVMKAKREEPEDWAAEVARKYIEATLNVPVETWDRDGRQGAHDLRYKIGDRSIAVEVKLVVDDKYRALERRISDTGYVCDNRLTRMWDVRLRWGARFNRVLREVVTSLSASSKVAGGTSRSGN